MSSYYQENNTSAIYREFIPVVSLPDEYNSIKNYTNFNNQVPLPTYNSKNYLKENVTKNTIKTQLPKINPY